MRIAFFWLSIALLCSCSPVRRLALPQAIHQMENRFQEHTGFVLYDLEKKKVIYEHRGDRYFTPASNTKILTFYTCLRILGDSIPALKYEVSDDSLIFWGMGDPSFLYRYSFTNPRVFDFLKGAPQALYFSPANFYSTHFGPGWAWDDYNSAYSSERSPFPVYGNLFVVSKKGARFSTSPSVFEKEFSIGRRMEKEQVIREIGSNQVRYHPGLSVKHERQWDVPFRTGDQLTCALLSDTLGKSVGLAARALPAGARFMYSLPADSLYRVMMQDSDNFIAEQLLLMCGAVVRDSLSSETAIRYSLRNYLYDLPDKPVWVDGSGLSRYNLVTPRAIVSLWQKIYDAVPRERLFALLATGGKSGTIKNWYKAVNPYIYGKTGTLSNNHTLSGFLVTRTGRTLIFSFMNSNYVTTTGDIRRAMETVLWNIHNNYK